MVTPPVNDDSGQDSQPAPRQASSRPPNAATHAPRNLLLAWAERGHLAPADLPRALSLAGATPTGQDWRHALDRGALWLAMLMLAASLVFFLAYNWNDMGRFAKFALVEALLTGGLVALWRLGLDSAGGKVVLFALSLFTGALLALIGQTYQTGADTFELFAAWAALMLPWALTGRLPALWLLWLALCNLAALLYLGTRVSSVAPLFWGFMSGSDDTLWFLFAFNTTALGLWEALASTRLPWLKARWATRLLATISGFAITLLACQAIGDGHTSALAGLLWAAWLAGGYLLYRRLALDGYMLTGGVLSVIVVICVFLITHLIDSNVEAGGLLLIGLVVIGLSAVGGLWLKNVLTGETP